VPTPFYRQLLGGDRLHVNELLLYVCCHVAFGGLDHYGKLACDAFMPHLSKRERKVDAFQRIAAVYNAMACGMQSWGVADQASIQSFMDCIQQSSTSQRLTATLKRAFWHNSNRCRCKVFNVAVEEAVSGIGDILLPLMRGVAEGHACEVPPDTNNTIMAMLADMCACHPLANRSVQTRLTAIKAQFDHASSKQVGDLRKKWAAYVLADCIEFRFHGTPEGLASGMVLRVGKNLQYTFLVGGVPRDTTSLVRDILQINSINDIWEMMENLMACKPCSGINWTSQRNALEAHNASVGKVSMGQPM
jgi:hypothetical protein